VKTVESNVSLAGRRRRDLFEAMIELEIVVAGPSASEGWLSRVYESLSDLVKALQAHIDEVEGPDGLLAQIIDEAPRLSAETDEFRREHVELLEACERTRKAILGARLVADGASETVRRHVTPLLGRLTAHRQRGSDLVYDAYNVDIAASD
jgi:hypothetical protein